MRVARTGRSWVRYLVLAKKTTFSFLLMSMPGRRPCNEIILSTKPGTSWPRKISRNLRSCKNYSFFGDGPCGAKIWGLQPRLVSKVYYTQRPPLGPLDLVPSAVLRPTTHRSRDRCTFVVLFGSVFLLTLSVHACGGMTTAETTFPPPNLG